MQCFNFQYTIRFQFRVEKYEYSVMIGCQFVSRDLYNMVYLGGVMDLYIEGSFHSIVFSVVGAYTLCVYNQITK